MRLRLFDYRNIRIRPAASYQGKECDVVIYSTFGEPIKKVWEDLERRRLFVAMTAACRTLIILSHLPSLKVGTVLSLRLSKLLKQIWGGIPERSVT